jgi:hypothetical protein
MSIHISAVHHHVGEDLRFVFSQGTGRIAVEEPRFVIAEDGREGVIELGFPSLAVLETQRIEGCPGFILVEVMVITPVQDVKKLVVDHSADIQLVVSALPDIEE